MTLMDDTPTANAETRAWLAREGLDGSTAPAEPPPPSDGAEEDHAAATLAQAVRQEEATAVSGGLAASSGRNGASAPARDVFTLARSELTQGRAQRAIELLVAELARERSPRGQFVRQTQVAYVMVESGLESVARPILERLVAQIDERKLEEWEAGALVAQPMALLCRVIDKAGGAADPQRAALYLRVCRLDPLQALALQR
jgi:type VI secretion system protein ImpA